MDSDARTEEPTPTPASSGTSGSTGAGQQADGGINALRGMIKSIVDEAIASLRPEQLSGSPRVAEGKMPSLSSEAIGGPPPLKFITLQRCYSSRVPGNPHKR